MASAPEVAVSDDGFEGAEELGEQPDEFETSEHARKALADAESFRRLRLYSKAIEVLHFGLERDPRSVELRDKLCQLLQESGDIEGAIDETITLAALYIDLGAPEHGQTLLYEVLQLAPDHPTALQMLEQLAGGVPVRQASWPDQEVTTNHQPGGYASAPPAADGYGESEPLPSFDLDDQSAPQHPYGGAETADSLDDVDDPFGEVAAPAVNYGAGTSPYGERIHRNAPLPSFNDIEMETTGPEPLDEFDDEAATRMVQLPDYDSLEYEELSPEPEEIEAEPVEATGEAIEEVLEEAEFFAARGLYDDARAILEDQLTRTPNHPLLLEQLQEVEQALATPGKSGTIQRSQLAALAPGGGVDEDRAFDIAASLDALDEIESVGPTAGGGGVATGADVNVEQVFEKFKAGVKAQVSESDASTHYDLGVAYREMGLHSDAVTEFELASRDPDRECMCHAMIGMIHLEQGELDKAAASYVRGLEATNKSVDQEMNLYYDLGNVKEMMGNGEEALYYFKKIARRDPGYRDVKDRIALLSSESAVPTRQGEEGEEDEFDQVFDELFESK